MNPRPLGAVSGVEGRRARGREIKSFTHSATTFSHFEIARNSFLRQTVRVKSILFSLLMTALVLDWRDALADIWRAAWAIVRSLWASRQAPNRERAILRLAHCHNCPFYDAPWQTCGTPGEMHDIDTRMKIGCWCYLPLATFDPTKDCYARANGLDVGWPDVLRPKAKFSPTTNSP